MSHVKQSHHSRNVNLKCKIFKQFLMKEMNNLGELKMTQSRCTNSQSLTFKKHRLSLNVNLHKLEKKEIP